MSREFDLLVFDWDGTLMESVRSIVDCTRAAMLDADLEPLPESEIREAIGMGLFDACVGFYPGIDVARYEIVVERYRHHWLSNYKDHSDLFPGVRATLETLVEAGHRLAIATAKSRKGLERELAKTGLVDLVRATRTVDEAPPKPDPTMLLGLMDELGVPPSRTLMIGDTTFDLDMAQNAGTAAVGVLCGSHTHAVLRGRQPLACLERVAELPHWLAERGAAEEIAR